MRFQMDKSVHQLIRYLFLKQYHETPLPTRTVSPPDIYGWYLQYLKCCCHYDITDKWLYRDIIGWWNSYITRYRLVCYIIVHGAASSFQVSPITIAACKQCICQPVASIATAGTLVSLLGIDLASCFLPTHSPLLFLYYNVQKNTRNRKNKTSVPSVYVALWEPPQKC